MAKKPDPEMLMREYREAYAAANPGRTVQIDYFGGWYAVFVSVQTKYRRTQIEAMTLALRERAAKRAAA